MNDRTLATLIVVGVWWLSTAILLRMVWSGRATYRISIGVCSVLAIAGLVGLRVSSQTETATAAYVSFGCAILVWAWHELVFLLGVVTGPRKSACPAGAEGWRRFVVATEVVIHHEVALALTVVAVLGLTWGQPNRAGASTFLVLWLMRLSAKLNVFLGVRNLSEQFVPGHLRYILSYFRYAKLNALMPVSLLVASGAVVQQVMPTLVPGVTAFVVVSHTLVAAILSLAVLEHVFLTLPLPDAVLWRWAIRSPLSLDSVASSGSRESVGSVSSVLSPPTQSFDQGPPVAGTLCRHDGSREPPGHGLPGSTRVGAILLDPRSESRCIPAHPGQAIEERV